MAAMTNVLPAGRIGKAVPLTAREPSRMATGSGSGEDPMHGKPPPKKMAVQGEFGVKAPGCGGSGSL